MIGTHKLEKMKWTLSEISKDMKNDATNFEGKLFTGKNVAEYLGNLGAAVSSLAEITKLIIEDIEQKESKEY